VIYIGNNDLLQSLSESGNPILFVHNETEVSIHPEPYIT
jgi:hypothetical protein